MSIEGILAPMEKKKSPPLWKSVSFSNFTYRYYSRLYGERRKITRNAKVRVIRDGIVIYTGTLGSLKRFKDDVKEVQAGYCGLNIDGYNDIKIGDIVEAYTIVSKRTL